MKSRIYNGEWAGNHPQHWLDANQNKVIGGQLVSEWTLTDVLPTEQEKAYFKIMFDGSQYYEGATPEEIAEANKSKVPCSISRMRLKLELFERNIMVEDIVDTINSIPSAVFSDAEKQKALIKFQEATSYDRYNADLNLIATLMGLSQEDLDEIFINGNQL